jgi:TRAP-type C4-dicarboxylate transport system permease small subunit
MMKYLRMFEKGVHKVSRFFSWIAAASLFVMVVLTTIDVAGRYVFNSPVIGTQDLVELGLVICVFGALGHVTLSRGHIRADMLNGVITKRSNAILSALSFIISAPIAILLTWQTASKAIENLKNMNIVTSTISVPVGPFFAFAAFGLLMLTIEMIFDIITYIKEAKDPDNPDYSRKTSDEDFTCL